MTLNNVQRMQVRLYNPADKNKWDDYVKRSNGSTLYHYSGWKTVIEKTFGHKTFYLMAADAHNEINGILPLVHMKSFIFGNFMVSMPYLNYGGVCADNNYVQDMLQNEAINIAQRMNAEYIELRHSRAIENGLMTKCSKVSMHLELPASHEALWSQFPSKLRSQIKKPQRDGLVARIGKEEEIESFYNVFSLKMRDLGTPVYPRTFFKNILEEFKKSAWICSVYKDEEPVASGFLFGFKDRLDIPWASSKREYDRFNPNMLLYWNSLKFACENGYRIFDFGRSTPGEGTYKFKEQWGAKPIQLYWHYWLRDGGPLPELNPKNPKYQMAIKIWKILPVTVTKFIGPKVVKNIP